MLNLKIKEPDYKQLYESRQAKIDSLNKAISGLKGRITRLENEKQAIRNNLTISKEMEKDTLIKAFQSKISDLSNQICNRDNKEKFNFELKEKELLNIIKKQANYIINKIN